MDEQCPVCDGTGWERYCDAAGDMDSCPCDRCNGTGRVARTTPASLPGRDGDPLLVGTAGTMRVNGQTVPISGWSISPTAIGGLPGTNYASRYLEGVHAATGTFGGEYNPETPAPATVIIDGYTYCRQDAAPPPSCSTLAGLLAHVAANPGDAAGVSALADRLIESENPHQEIPAAVGALVRRVVIWAEIVDASAERFGRLDNDLAIERERLATAYETIAALEASLRSRLEAAR